MTWWAVERFVSPVELGASGEGYWIGVAAFPWLDDAESCARSVREEFPCAPVRVVGVELARDGEARP